jgi:Uma2 family endonuclease
LAATYLGGGVPVYWLVNVQDRWLEVYTLGAAEPVLLKEHETVELVLDGQPAARIAVADLLPRA